MDSLLSFYISAILFVVILLASILFLVFQFRYREKYHKREKDFIQQQFETAQLLSQVEVAEQTFAAISSEIHDNVGQRLTLVHFYLDQLECSNPQLLSNVAELVDQALLDLRNLSKSLSGSYILQKGLELALEREVNLINGSGVFLAEYKCFGDYHRLTSDQEILIFRCAQEVLTNCLKHSGGNLINVVLTQSPDEIKLDISDNGVGMDKSISDTGIGLASIHNRINLLNGKIELSNQIPNGTKVSINVPTLSNETKQTQLS